jgi:hypothetical protein
MKARLCRLAGLAAAVTALAVPAAATRLAGGDMALAVTARPGAVEVALADNAGPVAAARASGRALLTVNGHRIGVALLPAGGNRLAGQAPFRPGDEVAIEVTVTLAGRTASARWGMPQQWPSSLP